MSTFVNNNVSSGAIVYASDHNEQGARIAAVVNGGLDDNNISSLSGTKIISATIPSAALDSNLAGGWNASPDAFTYGSNNGNKEFTVTTPSDVTGRYSPGMKIRFTRGTTAPTQCMSFTASSSQYASKSSPSGITFTSAFTVEAWVYLNSYTGQNQFIASRFDNAASSGGWRFMISSSGQLELLYGTGSSFTDFQTYQSVPLKRWVHVAGVVSSTSSKTGAIYINGTSVPVSSGLTSATSLTQASVDLRIGAASATPTNTYFDGYISEARVWSVAQSQANIQANMAISLTGSESNLVALFQGNGNFNDKTSNANNLTATNGAIATQAANPYNNTEYGEIVSVNYSAPNTTITLNTGDSCTIPNMTLTSAQYSTSQCPFGLPPDINGASLRRYVQICGNFTTSSASATQVTGLTVTVTIPSGGRRVKITVFTASISSTSSGIAVGTLWDGTVGSGTQLQQFNSFAGGGPAICGVWVGTPAAGSKTYNVGLSTTAGTATWSGASTLPSFILVEAI